jgi:CBS domain-containing protein
MYRRTVAEIAHAGVVTVEAATSLSEAFEIMRERGAGSLVVTEGSRPVGFFTEHDVVVKAREGFSFAGALVRDVMNRKLAGISRGELLDTVCLLFEKHHVRQLAVLDDKGLLGGMITYADIVRAYGMEYLVSNITCKEIMRNTGLVLAVKEEPLPQAMDRMISGNQTSALIVRDRKPEALLTETDIAALVADGGDPSSARVADIMRAPVVTVPLDSVVYKTIMFMNQMGIRQVVVIDDDGYINGLVSEAEIVNGIKRLG